MTREKWLQQFFKIVDRNRLERGKRLYHDEKTVLFKKKNNGFFAIVQGSRSKTYEVDAHFTTDESGFPDIEELAIECSCPDWVEYCKHSICSVIHYCKDELILPEQQSKGLSKHAQEINDTIHRDMEQIADLGPLPFLQGDQTLMRMQRIVQKKLRERSF